MAWNQITADIAGDVPPDFWEEQSFSPWQDRDRWHNGTVTGLMARRAADAIDRRDRHTSSAQIPDENYKRGE